MSSSTSSTIVKTEVFSVGETQTLEKEEESHKIVEVKTKQNEELKVVDNDGAKNELEPTSLNSEVGRNFILIANAFETCQVSIIRNWVTA